MATRLYPVWPLKDGNVATVTPDECYKVIHSNGIRVLWEPAVPCPCRQNTDTDNERYDCDICKDHPGWEYPIAMETLAVVANVEVTEMPYETLGRWEQGLAWVSVVPDQLPGFHDRYTLLDSVMVVQELVARGKDPSVSDRLNWPITTRRLWLTNKSGVAELTDVSVLHCRRQAADGTAGEEETLNTDFTVTADGRVDWTIGDALKNSTTPMPGGRYSIAYYGKPRYVVMNRPFAVRDLHSNRLHGPGIPCKAVPRQHAPLPVRSLCRLDWDQRE